MSDRSPPGPACVDLNALPLHELSDVLCDTGLVARLLELARDEDLGSVGDVTSEVSIPPDHRSRFRVVARHAGVVAGLIPAHEITNPYPEVAYAPTVRDGESVASGHTVARIAGPTRQILGLERMYLNLVGRLSGIATRTHKFIEAMGSGHRASLYDTRKTTPGLRVLEKYAVRCGGGRCHRIGLHDAVLLKDNHIAHVPIASLAAFVASAAERARRIWRERSTPAHAGFVEVEVDTLEQFAELLKIERGVVDMVLLDNMDEGALREAVAMRDASGSEIELEASGGVTLETIRGIAMTGVERISVGSITHGAVVLDFGLDAE